MIVCGDIGSKGFDERDDRTNLAGVIDALESVSETKLSPPGKPPCHICASFVFALMRLQASLALLIVEVAPYLESIRHVPGAANKEINAVGAHMVSERKAVLAHAVRKSAVVVPHAGQLRAVSTRIICVGKFDPQIRRVIAEKLWNVDTC